MIMWRYGDRAKVKVDWVDGGLELFVLGPAVELGQRWVPVLDPREEDPTFFKEAGLNKV